MSYTSFTTFTEYQERKNSPQMIIDMNQYNGRVNVVADPADPHAQFRLLEKVAIRNKATDYREALDGFRENTTLSRLFFSSENIQILQNALRAGVYKMSGADKYVVPPQNVDHLKVIMRTLFLENARNLPEDITGQIQALNDMVLNYCVPFVYGETVAYLNYLRDQSTLVVPLAREQKVDRDYKHLGGGAPHL